MNFLSDKIIIPRSESIRRSFLVSRMRAEYIHSSKAAFSQALSSAINKEQRTEKSFYILDLMFMRSEIIFSVQIRWIWGAKILKSDIKISRTYTRSSLCSLRSRKTLNTLEQSSKWKCERHRAEDESTKARRSRERERKEKNLRFNNFPQAHTRADVLFAYAPTRFGISAEKIQ